MPGPVAQARKLGARDGVRLLVDHRPPGWAFEQEPPDVIAVGAGEPCDVVLTFVERAEDLAERFAVLAPLIRPAGSLWIAWPRRAGGHRSDVTDNAAREHGLAVGLVDTKVAAIDADWSGLRFVWRLANR